MNILYYANPGKIARGMLTERIQNKWSCVYYSPNALCVYSIVAYSAVINESYLFVLPWPPRLTFILLTLNYKRRIYTMKIVV